MSVAMPAQKSGPGSTVSIFGRKISWDALLVASAGLLGVIFLYRVGQPSAAVPAGLQSSDTASGGGSSGLSTTQLLPATTAPDPFTSPGAFLPNYGASTPTPPPPRPSGPGGGGGPQGPQSSSSTLQQSVSAGQSFASQFFSGVGYSIAPGVGIAYKPGTASGPAPYSANVLTVTPKAGATHV